MKVHGGLPVTMEVEMYSCKLVFRSSWNVLLKSLELTYTSGRTSGYLCRCRGDL